MAGQQEEHPSNVSEWAEGGREGGWEEEEEKREGEERRGGLVLKVPLLTY